MVPEFIRYFADDFGCIFTVGAFLLDSTRETVAVETWAALATSLIVAFIDIPSLQKIFITSIIN